MSQELIIPIEADESVTDVVLEPPIVQNNMEIFPMPLNIKSPYATYYIPLQWNHGFTQWNLVRFGTPMDGNCLFHAIANSFFEPYHTQQLNGTQVDRSKIISLLRKELSDKLGSKINDTNSYYDLLHNGTTIIFSQSVPEFKLEYMQAQLNSNFPIGYGYMEFIGNCLNKDIYILEAIRQDLYVTDELPLTIKGNRPSIVLHYLNGHYELVGIKNNNGSFTTHFSPDHSFISFLFSRVQDVVNRSQ